MEPDDWLGEAVYDIPGGASGYKLRLSFAVLNGRPEVVGLEMWGADPRTQPDKWGRYDPQKMRRRDNNFDVLVESPIFTSDLRGVALQSLTSAWVAKTLKTAELILDDSAGAPASADWKRRVRKFQKELEATKPARPGRKPIYGPEHFKKVAAVYRKAERERQPPTKAVADWGKVNRSTANKWVGRARNEFGLLPKTTQGKAASVNAPSKQRRTRKP